MFKTNIECRICKSQALEQFLSLGLMPPANAFLTADQLKEPEMRFPLAVCLCGNCALVQLKDVVDPELLFKNYVYASSTSSSFRAHFQSFAEQVYHRFKLDSESLVVDVGSNDGILLKPFKELGARILGVDPAENLARIATEAGIDTLPVFFGIKTAQIIAEARGKAHILTANNVFAHVDDLDSFVKAVRAVLREDGVFIFEVPYLVDLLTKNLFDTIYHEHLSYFSLKPLLHHFQKQEMQVFEVQKVDSHGGSLRVFVRNAGAGQESADSVRKLLELEEDLAIYSLETWRSFSDRVQQNREKFRNLFQRLKSAGKRIAGYGAPAKGNTLLNYFGITHRELEYIADDSPLKQNLFTPGSHIPVSSPDRLSVDRPDYVLILAWNFADSIMERLSSFRSSGGKFILPVPSPEVIEN
ncbi:class I SAM-dependent methyltransferase [bacterium]|nr:class I SAM-dependent methyltransferase [bacterium]MCI0604080.1 class I SAM-dependent methyltransferase [bacterium]